MIYHPQPKSHLQPLPASMHPNISGNVDATVAPSSTLISGVAGGGTNSAAQTAPENQPLYVPAPNSSFLQDTGVTSGGLSSQQMLLGGGAIIALLVAFLFIKRKYFPNEY